MTNRALGIGLIGSGYLGKAYALGYRSAPIVFGPLPVEPRLELVATGREDTAREAAAALGFARWTTDWRALVTDPAVDVVIVNTPNWLHAPMAQAALAAGKHVHAEKPLGLDAAQARAMTEAAREAGVKTIVGFNYRQNPATCLAREIVAGGEIGAPIAFRGTHNEDYLADLELPFSWKCERAKAGGGALLDVGSHILATALWLMGPVAEVCAQTALVHRERPVAKGSPERRPVETEDIARLLLRFSSGATGVVECSRIATGRKMQLTYEVTGTEGSLFFDQERLSELHLYRASDPPGRRGFARLLLDEHHPRYGAFGMGPGHGLGFNDQKIIECHELIRAILDDRPASPDFAEALAVQEVTDAALRSAARGRWVRVESSGAQPPPGASAGRARETARAG